MTPVRTETISRERYAVFLGKAEEFHTAARRALSVGDTNAAASAASHAAISAFDALVAFHLGLRCKGENHGEVIQLLRRAPVGDTVEKERQFLQLVDIKRVAEYHDRDVTPVEGELALKLATRVLEWVRTHLPPS